MSRTALVTGALTTALLVVLTFPSCQQESYQDRVLQTEKSLVHAIHSERLEQIMLELDRLAANRLPQEVDADTEKQRRVAAIRDVAWDMAGAAAHIPDVLQDVALDDENREEFAALAEDLRVRSLELHDQIPQLSVEQAQERVNGLLNSCQDCHARFRVLPAAPPR